MFASLGIRIAGVAAVVAAFAFLVGWVRLDSARITAYKSQIASCRSANESFAAEVAEQNKKIGDLLQETQQLENEAAAKADSDRAATKVRIRTVEKVVIPKGCSEAIKWANAQSPSLSSWSRQ